MSRAPYIMILLGVASLAIGAMVRTQRDGNRATAMEKRIAVLESRISLLEREVFLAQFQISQKAPRVERDETSVPFPYFDPTLLVPDSAPLQYDSWKNVIHK